MWGKVWHMTEQYLGKTLYGAWAALYLQLHSTQAIAGKREGIYLFGVR